MMRGLGSRGGRLSRRRAFRVFLSSYFSAPRVPHLHTQRKRAYETTGELGVL